MAGLAKPGDPLQAGSAEVLITPPLGASLAGYYHDPKADDILDDLFARALVVTSGSTTVAVVVCDLIGLERALTQRARALIEQRTGIPPKHVLICCTHTHTGPTTTTRRSFVMRADGIYLDLLARKIADAVQLAFQRRQPASLYAGRGHAEGIAFNRRFWMKDGTLRTNPPLQSPDIDRPARPIDPELGILLARDAGGEPLALLSNYALHADEVGGTAICADYQGVESRLLKQVLGKRCVVLCPNGCCGDINHLDVSKPREKQQGFPTAQRSGTVLAGEVIQRLPDLEPVASTEEGAPRVTATSRTIEAELRLPTPDEVAWAEQTSGGELHGFNRAGLDVVKAHRILEIQARGLTRIPLEISAIALGDVALVGLPGEIFVDLGLAIKRQATANGMPFRYAWIAELCNDSVGYIPTQVAYDEGGYESTSSPLQPGTGERIVATALELLQELV